MLDNNRMSGSSDNLVLEHLRHSRNAVGEVRADMREVKTRLGFLEAPYAHVSSRIDRVEERLERIERRVGLADA
jgi:hypothetical protein